MTFDPKIVTIVTVDQKDISFSSEAVQWGEGKYTVIPWAPDYVPTDFVRETVGSYFKGWDGHTYKCVAFDLRFGFWMMRPYGEVIVLRDVSSRAIGATYRQQYTSKNASTTEVST